MCQNSSGPIDGKAIRKISRGQGLRNFRVEEALMGIHDPRSLHLLFCNWNAKLFLCCFFFVLWFQLDESLTPGTASEKTSSLLPHSLAYGCPCPLPCRSLNSSLCFAFVPFIEQGPVFRAFERCRFSSHWSPSALISVCDQEQRLLLVLSCFSMCFLASQHALSFLGFGQCFFFLLFRSPNSVSVFCQLPSFRGGPVLGPWLCLVGVFVLLESIRIYGLPW